jgi:hypothetical protein
MARLPARNLPSSRPHPDPACARRSLLSALRHAVGGGSPPAPSPLYRARARARSVGRPGATGRTLVLKDEGGGGQGARGRTRGGGANGGAWRCGLPSPPPTAPLVCQLSGLFVAAGRNSQKVSALVHVVSVERTFENVPWSSGQSFLIFLYIFACSVGCRPWLPAHPPSFAPCLRASGRACMHAQLLSRCVLHRGRKERRSLGAEPMGRISTSSSLRTMVLHGTTPWLHFIARNATG